MWAGSSFAYFPLLLPGLALPQRSNVTSRVLAHHMEVLFFSLELPNDRSVVALGFCSSSKFVILVSGEK